MANKFQKSVLERLEQDAARQKEKPKENQPLSKIEMIQATTPTDWETKELHAIEPQIIPPAITKEAANMQLELLQEIKIETMQHKPELPVLPDINDYLRREPQRMAKNKTFYLDAEVITAIKSTAKSQDVTDSKLVNDILRRVLGLSER